MKGKKILIINPDSHLCQVLENALAQAGCRACTAVNGLEARPLVQTVHPQIVVMVEHLPDGTATDLVTDILSNVPDCLFLILNDNDSDDKRIPSHLQGTLRYLKPPLILESILKDIAHMSEIADLHMEKRNTEVSLLKRNMELEHINERLRQVVESTRRLTSFSGTGDISPLILQEFAGTMNATGGSLFLHRNNELVLACSLGPNHVPNRIPLPLSDNSVMNLVISKNEPVLIEDIRKGHPLKPSGWSGYTDHSLLAFPLLEKQGSIVGIITLHNKKDPPFTNQDRELGSILASYGSETLRATQAIENLRQSEERARIILEANPDPVVVFDNEKKVRYFNPAFSQVFGWTLNELKGNLMDAFIPDNTLIENLTMKQMEEKGVTYSGIETRRYSKSGQTIPVSISGAVFCNNSGKVLGSVCNIRDITSQKAMESQLIQGQKMEAIGTLASGIAHDFNNILSAIFGNLDLALMDLAEGIPARKNIENILKAAHRAKNLVSQILAFSRKSSSEGEASQKIQPHLIIKEALFLIRASLPSTIEIKERFLDKTGTILANPTRFHQIIMNLCTNAHHAMKENGGKLTIKLEKIKETSASGIQGTQSYVKLSISDTGCGMDENTVKRIFDPYFTTKDKDLGTGLGLSVVHKIVEESHGRISVFSYPGHGTRFELLFPEAGGQAQSLESSDLEIEKGSGNVLFVDDESEIAALGVTLLQRLGYKAVASTHPMEALELIKRAPDAFDIVITDMTMPKMTGIRLAEALKMIRPDLPVILCTGFNRSEIEDRIPANTIDAILKKPVGLLDFSQTITQMIKSDRRPKPPLAPEFPLSPS